MRQRRKKIVTREVLIFLSVSLVVAVYGLVFQRFTGSQDAQSGLATNLGTEISKGETSFAMAYGNKVGLALLLLVLLVYPVRILVYVIMWYLKNMKQKPV